VVGGRGERWSQGQWAREGRRQGERGQRTERTEEWKRGRGTERVGTGASQGEWGWERGRGLELWEAEVREVAGVLERTRGVRAARR
jgi:hypothetical protein